MYREGTMGLCICPCDELTNWWARLRMWKVDILCISHHVTCDIDPTLISPGAWIWMSKDLSQCWFESMTELSLSPMSTRDEFGFSMLLYKHRWATVGGFVGNTCWPLYGKRDWKNERPKITFWSRQEISSNICFAVIHSRCLIRVLNSKTSCKL